MACTGDVGTARMLGMAHSFREHLARDLEGYLGDSAFAAELEGLNRVEDEEIAAVQREFVSVLTI